MSEARTTNLVEKGAPKNYNTDSLKTLAISPDGKLIYTGGYGCEDINVLRSDDLGFVEYLEGHTDCVFSVKVIAHTKHIISGGRDFQMILWSFKNCGGKTIHRLVKQIKHQSHFVTVCMFGDLGFGVNTSRQLVMVNFGMDPVSKSILSREVKRDHSDLKCACLDPYVFAIHSNSGSPFAVRASSKRFNSVICFNTKGGAITLAVVQKLSLVISGTVSGQIVLNDLTTNQTIHYSKVLFQEAGSVKSISLCETRNLLVLGSRYGVSLMAFHQSPNKRIPVAKRFLTVLGPNLQCVVFKFNCDGIIMCGRSTVKSFRFNQQVFNRFINHSTHYV